MKYEVMEIKTEKRFDGNSSVSIRSLEKNSIILKLVVQSIFLDDIDYMKQKADEKYNRVTKEIMADREYAIKVGDILSDVKEIEPMLKELSR